MQYICEACGSINTFNEGNECSVCKEHKIDSESSYLNKEVKVLSEKEIKSVRNLTASTIKDFLFQILKTKSTSNLANLEIIETAVIHIPYSKVLCEYSFDFDYEAVDTQQESYTEYVKKSDYEEGRGWYTYTVPETKTRTIEVNMRTVTRSGSGEIDFAYLSANLEKTLKSYRLRDHEINKIGQTLGINKVGKIRQIFKSSKNFKSTSDLAFLFKAKMLIQLYGLCVVRKNRQLNLVHLDVLTHGLYGRVH